MNKLKALIIDDSVLYRKILSDALSAFPNVEVVGTAHNGRVGIDKIKKLSPDIITLDFEMPELNGIETLKEIKRQNLNVKAIMISSQTQKGAQVTIDALNAGAFDFIAKPEGNNFVENTKTLSKQLLPLIRTLSVQTRLKTSILNRKTDLLQSKKIEKTISTSPCKIVALGISTGGPTALANVIPKLPATLKVPLVLVQHMPPVFTKALADSLNKKSEVNVVEAEDGMKLTAGTVYIAPGAKQMKVEYKFGGNIIKITDAPHENNCKPSVDYLFRSISEVYKGGCLGVIMTGMGADGTKGLKIMKEYGVKVIAQDKASCVVFGMPMEAIKADVVDVIIPLDKIADEIIKSVK